MIRGPKKVIFVYNQGYDYVALDLAESLPLVLGVREYSVLSFPWGEERFLKEVSDAQLVLVYDTGDDIVNPILKLCQNIVPIFILYTRVIPHILKGLGCKKGCVARLVPVENAEIRSIVARLTI